MPRARRILLVCGSSFGAALLLAQFFRPELANPPVTADLSAPAPVKAILRRACYDCHSNETRLPWFDRIVPAYWLVVHDVTEGRKRLNFSEIGKLPEGKQKAALFESVNHVLLGAMPPKPYSMMHPEAEISGEELSTLKGYLSTLVVAPRPPAPVGPPPSAPLAPSRVPPAPNGIAFPADYGSWKPVSVSERFDNGTLRAILGNDAAIRAIRERRIAPWPDGAALAKVAWQAVAEPDGGARSGDFWQVEFMFKERRRYANTLGWGFARWRGTGLTPYGKDASFTEECVGCHAPVKDSDFVFTNVEAIPPSNDGRVLGLGVNSARSELSLLRGTPGATLTFGRWPAVEDPRWFGARTPSGGPAARGTCPATEGFVECLARKGQ